MKDIAIIGAGPVGLLTIFQAGMLGLNCHIIDALEFVGGQCVSLYPEKPIYDIPAYPKITGKSLIDQLQKQADPFKAEFHLGQTVTHIKGDCEDGFTLTLSGKEVRAKTIIIAGGAGLFEPRKPPLKQRDLYEETSILYSVPNIEAMRDQDIVIAGGGDSALDWAISLCEVANTLHLVHRREEFRAFPKTLDTLYSLVEQGKIKLHTGFQLQSLRGDAHDLTGVTIRSSEGTEKTLKANKLLPFFGLKHRVHFLKEWNLEESKGGIQVDPTTFCSSIKGIYGVGDMARYPNKLKLILTGFSEASMAVHHAYQIIHNGKEPHFEHSTTKGVAG